MNSHKVCADSPERIKNLKKSEDRRRKIRFDYAKAKGANLQKASMMRHWSKLKIDEYYNIKK